MSDNQHECSFCHSIPKLRVTPGSPDDPIGICIDCALKSVNILVAGAVQLLDAMKRADAAKRAGGTLVVERPDEDKVM